MKLRNETRVVITHSNQRARLLTNPDGTLTNPRSTYGYLKFSNGAVQKHPIAALRSTDNKTRTKHLEAAQEAVIESACHQFLAENPSAWQSEPATMYEEE
jgi:hypothetical protein